MLHNRIKEIRESKGISQQLLADMVGVSAMTISRCEQEKTFPNLGTCLKICQVLGKYLDEVFYLEEKGEAS